MNIEPYILELEAMEQKILIIKNLLLHLTRKENDAKEISKMNILLHFTTLRKMSARLILKLSEEE